MQETQETCIRSLGQKDPLEEKTATHSSIFAGNPKDRGARQDTVHGVSKSQTQLSTAEQHSLSIEILKTVLLSSVCMNWTHFSGYILKQSITKLFSLLKFLQLFRQRQYGGVPIMLG